MRQPTPLGWSIKRGMADHDPPLNQRQLGELAGVSQSTVSRWIYNPLRPDDRHLRTVAKLLGLNVEDLLARAGYGPTSQAEPAEEEEHEIITKTRLLLDRTSPMPPHKRQVLEQTLAGVLAAYADYLPRQR